MELWRLKNTDTRIVFPIVDADGDPTSDADDNTPDSEWLSWNTSDHGGAAPSFSDCTHEYVEIAGGFYYLDVQAAEINKDFTLIQMKTALAGCKTQAILIRTYVNSNEDLHGHITDIESDTNELQTDLVNGGRLDLLVDAIKAKTDNLPAAPADDTSIDSQLAAIAGYLDTEVAAILADTNELQVEFVDGGRLDLLVDAIKAKTDNLPSDPADQSAVEAAITAAHSTTNGKIDTVDDLLDLEVADIHTDVGAVKTVVDAVKLKTDNLPATPADDTSIDSQLAAIAGYLDTEVAAILADTNELQVEFVDGGRLDLLVDAIKAKTDNLPSDPADQSAVEAAITAAHSTTNGKIDTVDDLLDLEVADIHTDVAAVKTVVDAIKAKTDNLPATPADDTSIDSQLAAIAGYLDTEVAAILADTNELQTDLANGGRLDLLVDAIKAKTDNLPSDPADQSAVEAAITAAHSTTNGKIDTVDDLLDLEVADIHTDVAAVKTVVDAIKAKTDNLPAAPADDTSIDSQLAAIAGYLDTEVAAILADTNELQTDLVNGGRFDLLVDAIKAKTDNLPATPADDTSIDSQLAAIKAIADKLDDTFELDVGTYRFTANALETSPAGSAPTVEQIRAEIDSNSTQLSAIVADTNELQVEFVNGGRLDLLVDAIKAKTDNLPSDPADQSAVEAAITAAHSTTNGKIDTVDDLLDLEAADIHTDVGAVKTVVDAIKAKTDNLPATPADDTSIDSQLAAIAGYLDTEVAAILADTAELQTDLANGGRLDLLVDAIKAKTDNLPATPADDTSIDSQLAAVKTVVDAVKVVTDNVAGMYETDGAVKRFTANALEESPSGGATVGDIADAVWDEAIADHTTATTFGGKNQKVVPSETINDYKADVSGLATSLALAAAKTVVDTINGHITADYGSTEKAAIDLLDDVDGGLADIHTVVGNIHINVADVHADVGTVDATTAAIKAKTDNLPYDPADQSAVEAAITAAHSTTNGKIDIVDDYVDLEIADIHADVGAVKTVVDAVKLKTDNLPTDPADASDIAAAVTAIDDYVDTEIAAILADTNELQTDLVNGGRLDLLIDSIITKVDAVDDYVDTEIAALKTILDDIHNTDLPAVKTVVDAIAVDTGDVSDIKAVTDKLDTAMELDGVVYRFTANSLEEGPASAITALAIRQEMDANSTQLAAIVADTNELQGDLKDGGRVDLLIDAINAKTTNLPADPADASDIAAAITTIDDFIDTEIAAILADTNELQGDWANGGRLDLLIDAIKAKTDNIPAAPIGVGAKMDLVDAPNSTALDAIADAMLNRDWSAVSDTNARTVLNALRLLRNKASKAATGVVTVTKEDDIAPAWTSQWESTVSNDPA